MAYIHQTNNTIDVVARWLPRSHGTTSGLNKATPEELKALGWIPVVDVRPEYSPAFQRLVHASGAKIGDAVPIDANSVDRVYAAVSAPANSVSVLPSIRESRDAAERTATIAQLKTAFTSEQVAALLRLQNLKG